MQKDIMVELDKMDKPKKDRTVKQWMEVFSELYSKTDADRTPEQMWIAVMAHTSSIGEAIRKSAFESLMDSAAHTFCWLCSFVNKLNKLQDDIFSINETLCGIVSLKYPDVCGHCRKKPCACEPVSMEKKKDKSAEYGDLLDRRRRILTSFEGYSIDDSIRMFGEIYCGRIHIQTLESIGFHFLEEIGEAAVRVRQLSQLRKIADDPKTEVNLDFLRELTSVEGIVSNYAKYHEQIAGGIDYASKDPNMLRSRIVDAKMGLVVEIGDSYSWFCGIMNKLDSISTYIYNEPEKHPEVVGPLEPVLTKIYFDAESKLRCPSCKSNPCACTFFNLTDVK
jgi:NTP pyrophosphatase (non-canonical NTP hydrolase)